MKDLNPTKFKISKQSAPKASDTVKCSYKDKATELWDRGSMPPCFFFLRNMLFLSFFFLRGRMGFLLLYSLRASRQRDRSIRGGTDAGAAPRQFGESPIRLPSFRLNFIQRFVFCTKGRRRVYLVGRYTAFVDDAQTPPPDPAPCPTY